VTETPHLVLAGKARPRGHLAPLPCLGARESNRRSNPQLPTMLRDRPNGKALLEVLDFHLRDWREYYDERFARFPACEDVAARKPMAPGQHQPLLSQRP